METGTWGNSGGAGALQEGGEKGPGWAKAWREGVNLPGMEELSVCASVHIYVGACVCVYMCTCACACICMHTHMCGRISIESQVARQPAARSWVPV